MILVAGVTWPLVILFAVIFAVICFLAALWSQREWRSRKIRIGMFLEREYRVNDGPTRNDAKRNDANGGEDATEHRDR